MIENLETSSQGQVTIDDITEISNINLINDLTDLILAKNSNNSNIWVLRNYKDDSLYSSEESVYYTTAENLKEAQSKFSKYVTDFSTITAVKTIRLPLIPKFI